MAARQEVTALSRASLRQGTGSVGGHIHPLCLHCFLTLGMSHTHLDHSHERLYKREVMGTWAGQEVEVRGSLIIG